MAESKSNPANFDVTTRRGRERARERWAGIKNGDLDESRRQDAYADGYEPGPDGYMTGRDPRTMSPVELTGLGHKSMSPQDALRLKCLDCCAGSPNEVRLCVAITCPNWPFRMGKSPWKVPRRLTEEQQQAARERGRALAAKQRGG